MSADAPTVAASARASVAPAWLLRALRLPAGFLVLLVGVVAVRWVFPRLDAPARNRVIVRWARALLGCFGVRVRVVHEAGAAPLLVAPESRMLLANHVSWIDIFAILAVAPAAFVAKAEIAGWPLAGRLVSGAGTIFIDRGRRRAVHEVNARITERLHAGQRVAVFPEGTNSDGRRLLPFHASLVQAARDAGVPITPIGLRYLDPDGSPSHAALYVGDTHFIASLWKVTGHPRLIVEAHILRQIEHDPESSRGQRVEFARQAISACLGLALEDTESETLRGQRDGPR